MPMQDLDWGAQKTCCLQTATAEFATPIAVLTWWDDRVELERENAERVLALTLGHNAPSQGICGCPYSSSPGDVALGWHLIGTNSIQKVSGVDEHFITVGY